MNSQKKKILVIEDEHPLRKDVLEMLSYEGFETIGAENGAVGLEMARAHLPDLIICDIMMPGDIKGFEVLEELRRERLTALIPFIFLTARTDRLDQRHGMELGADDYLTKPFKIAELLAAVNVRLKKREEMTSFSDARMEALRENLITALPHELRTPLNTVIGFADMLIADASTLQPAQITEWAQLIHSAGLRLHRLIENYLVYARVETLARMPEQAARLRQNRTLSPGDLIEYEALSRAHQHRREADLVLNVRHEDCKLAISEDDLRKIANELIDNAFKFSDPGTPVRVQCAVNGDSYVMVVADSGRGMTPEQVQAVGAYMQFERWVYEQQGMGLGLVIASRLAQVHNGTLKVESVYHQGTMATVTLPLM